MMTNKSDNAKIVGVDIVASAIDDAQKNAKRNNIDGLQFYAADVGKFLTAHPQYKDKRSEDVV
jgi:tRNA/tmRNA/rRNA uracil-C5-methylase (TrmA/RlmC/RlmD family)